eukprot:sb/3471212/
MNQVPEAFLDESLSQINFQLKYPSSEINQQMKRTSIDFVEGNDESTVVQCKIKGCFVWKSSDKDLYQHIRDDHPDRKHFCEVCPMSFTSNYNLVIHQQIHYGIKSFKCEECGKMFGQSSNYKRHKRGHTGECPFKCEVCGKQFTQKGSMKSHMRIHTGEKPFSCSNCGKLFHRSDNRLVHELKCSEKK